MSVNEQQQEKDLGLNIPLLIYIARKNLWYVLGIFAIFGLAIFLYLRYTPQLFNSYAIVQVRSSNAANQFIGGGTNNMLPRMDIHQDLEFLKSFEFFKKASEQLPLQISYFKKGRILDMESYKATPYSIDLIQSDPLAFGLEVHLKFTDNQNVIVSYTSQKKLFEKSYKISELIITPIFSFRITGLNEKYDKDELNGYYFKINDLSKMQALYHSKIKISLVSDVAQTIKISLDDESVQKAADRVNTIATFFLESDLDRKSQSTEKMISFIDDQINNIYKDLKKSEEDIVSFQKENKLVEDNSKQNIILQQKNVIEAEITTLELNERILKSVVDRIGSLDSISKIVELVTFLPKEINIHREIDKLYTLYSQRQELLFDYKNNSSSIKYIEHNIKNQEKILRESLQSNLKNITLKKELLKDKLGYFIVNVEENTLPEKKMEFGKLEKVYKINEKFHTLFIEKKAEFEIAKSGFVSENVILQQGKISSIPIYPKPTIVYLILLSSAFIVSIIMVYVKYLLYNKLSNVEEIIKGVGPQVSVLGIISKFTQTMNFSQLVVHKKPKSVITESFRNARTNLQFILENQSNKIISITSTVSGEGKTFVAINLAGILALMDKKVVILDLDMRKPKVHLGFNSTNTNGMSTLLIKKNTIEECIKVSDIPTLHFITSGPVPPNPSELILNGELKNIVDKLLQNYDYVIFDTPPSGLVTDGLECATMADCLIYLFRAEYSKKSFMANLQRISNDKKYKNICFVLNDVDYKYGPYAYASRYGYDYGYGYGYGHGYGYGYSYGREYAYGYGEKAGYYD